MSEERDRERGEWRKGRHVGREKLRGKRRKSEIKDKI